eukprot:UN00063
MRNGGKETRLLTLKKQRTIFTQRKNSKAQQLLPKGKKFLQKKVDSIIAFETLVRSHLMAWSSTK